MATKEFPFVLQLAFSAPLNLVFLAAATLDSIMMKLAAPLAAAVQRPFAAELSEQG